MRIISTVTNDLSHDQRMIRICTSLSRAGYEVWLVGRERHGRPPLPDRPFRQVRLRCRFENGKFFYLEYNLRLLIFLLRHRFDIINSVDLDTLLPGYLLSYMRGKPLVYDAHEYFTETPEVVRRRLVQTAWEWLAGELIPKLKYCYTVGPQLARLFRERYKVPFTVIRNLPNEKIITEEKMRSETKILLYQGMLNEARGLEAAIRAMPLLPPEVQLWLAGNGDIKTELEQLTESLDLVGRVRFYGFVPPADLPLLTSQAWLGLNLLENKGLSYYYSLANKAFDYIQAGLPSVHMDFPEYRALQEQYGVFILLEDLEPPRFARQVQLLLDDPLRYEELARNCRRAARELTWEREEEKLLEFYRSII